MAVDVQVGGLIGGKSIEDALAGLADLVQAIEALFQVQVGQAIGEQFQAQVSAPFLILPEETVFPIGAEDMTTVLDVLQDRLQFAVEMPADAVAEDLADPISGKAVETQLAATLKDVSDGPVALEDDIPAVFQLLDGPGAAQAFAGQAFLGRELGAEGERPVVEALANDLGAQSMGCSLQRFGILDRRKGIVLLSERNLLSLKTSGDELMPIEVGTDRKGDKGGHPQDHVSQSGVVDVKIVMPVVEELRTNHPIIGIFGGMAELDGAERTASFLAHEDVVNAKALGATGSLESGGNDFFMAERFAFAVARHPDQRDLAITRIGLDPADVVIGPATKDLFGDDRFFEDVMKEMNDVVLGSEKIQVAIDHDSIKAMINELNPRGEKSKKKVHRRPLSESSGSGGLSFQPPMLLPGLSSIQKPFTQDI